MKIKKRTIRTTLMATATLFVAACQQMPIEHDNESNFTRVTVDTIPLFYGKKISLEGNHIVLAEDGTFDGTWRSEPIAGKWEMRDGYWCRVLTVFFQADRLNQEDCQLWESSEGKLRGTRSKGKGQSFVYSVEQE